MVGTAKTAAESAYVLEVGSNKARLHSWRLDVASARTTSKVAIPRQPHGWRLVVLWQQHWQEVGNALELLI
jgi:hypothetical protein